jgi:hypothetical protein
MRASDLVGQHAFEGVLGLQAFVYLERSLQSHMLLFSGEALGHVDQFTNLREFTQADLPWGCHQPINVRELMYRRMLL